MRSSKSSVDARYVAASAERRAQESREAAVYAREEARRHTTECNSVLVFIVQATRADAQHYSTRLNVEYNKVEKRMRDRLEQASANEARQVTEVQ